MTIEVVVKDNQGYIDTFRVQETPDYNLANDRAITLGEGKSIRVIGNEKLAMVQVTLLSKNGICFLLAESRIGSRVGQGQEKKIYYPFWPFLEYLIKSVRV